MNRSLRFPVGDEDAGQRLDRFLWSRVADLSRMRIANLIGGGACLVNQAPAPAGYHLAAGDVVEITFENEPPGAMTPEPIALDIVYEDDYLIVIDKPSGMLVHPTRSVKTGTLANALAYHLNKPQISDLRFEKSAVRPGLVHRLDKATSGLMVAAKTPRALSILSRHFHHRLVEKRYLAVARGRIADEAGVIQAPIGRDPDSRPQWRVSQEGRPAETRFRVIKRGRDVTLVELEPVTGRTNQLRIHLAHIGHPVTGDDMYGEVARSPARLALHACRLAFHHPAGGRWMEFTSALPRDIARLLDE